MYEKKVILHGCMECEAFYDDDGSFAGVIYSLADVKKFVNSADVSIVDGGDDLNERVRQAIQKSRQARQ